MRILSGQAKGRTLKTREGKGTRPTDSRSREALFNIVGERVIDARVLDLYAGSGAVGLEALSRGAAHAVFVEQNVVACNAIRQNLRVLGWQEQARVWSGAVAPTLPRLLESGGRFDFIFADPPFTRPEELKRLAERLDNCSELLHNVGGQFRGLLVIQHHRKTQPQLSAKFAPIQQRRAGESLLSFYHLSGEPGAVERDTGSDGEEDRGDHAAAPAAQNDEPQHALTE